MRLLPPGKVRPGARVCWELSRQSVLSLARRHLRGETGRCPGSCPVLVDQGLGNSNRLSYPSAVATCVRSALHHVRKRWRGLLVLQSYREITFSVVPSTRTIT